MFSKTIFNAVKASSNFQRLCNTPHYGVLSHEKFKKKTAGFGKPRILLYEFFEVLFQGTIDQFRDTRIMIEYMAESQKTAYMLQQIDRTKSDLFKFVPFSAFLIIPFAELLLPPYMYFFPNALPTTYVFDDSLEKTYLKKDRKQMNSQRFLFQHIKRKFPELENVRDSQEYTPKTIQRWVVDNQAKLSSHLDYNHMNSEQLVHVCKFFEMEFVRGTYIIMKCFRLIVNLPVNIYNLFKILLGQRDRMVKKNILQNWNIKLFFPLEDMKRHLLLYQIRRHLRKINQQDKAFKKFGFEDQTIETLRVFARERGMTATVVQKDPDVEIDAAYAQRIFKRDWIEYCDKEQVFENMKLWYAILYYERYHSSIVRDYEKRVHNLINH